MATYKELLKRVQNIAKTAKRGTKTKLFEFTKDCYKAKLSSSIGVSSTDLKPKYSKLYTYMLVKYEGRLVVENNGKDRMDVQVYLK